MRGRQKRVGPARLRIVRMLERGTELHELDRCLNETRKPLISAGAKADNLPKGLNHQAEFVESLSLKAEDLVCAWFRKQADFTGYGDPEAAAQALFADPDCNDRAIWRAVLRAFVFREQTPVVGHWLNGASSPIERALVDAAPSVESGISAEDVEQCLSIAQGNKPVGAQRLLPMFMAGTIAAARGDAKTAESWIYSLESLGEATGSKLAEAIKAVKSTATPGLSPTRAPLLASSMVNEVDHLPFIGIVKKILPSGQLFVSLAALKVDGIFYEVPTALAKQVFPETGDATVFPSSISKPFTEGEVGLWTAVCRGPEHATRCVVERTLARPFLPVRVPHPSTDPDAVRNWMLHVYKPSVAHQPLFVLTDGVAVRLPSGQSDPGRVEFDTPLDGYRDIQWMELASTGISFVADLPTQVEKFDFSPPSTLVKRLFKKLKESAVAPSFSKNEIQSIAELADTDQASAFSIQRALDRLRNAADAKNLLEAASAELLGIPAVVAIVEAEKSRVADAHAQEVLQAQKALDEVGRKKLALEGELEQLRAAIRKEIEQQKRSVKQQEADLIRRMRLAFEKASQEGADALAQSAVIKAVLRMDGAIGGAETTTGLTVAGVSAAALPPPTEPVSSAPEPQVGSSLPSVRALRRAVEARSTASGLNETLLASVLAAAWSSPVIGIAGGAAGSLVQAVADVIAAGLHCRASVAQDMFNVGDLMRSTAVARQAGNVWAVTVGDYLEMASAAGIPAIIELRGANRAPLETLLPELLDCGPGGLGVSWRDASGTLRHAASGVTVVWMMTFADGKTVFPVPAGLAFETPLLSTEGWPLEQPQPEPAFVASSINAKIWSDLGASAGVNTIDASLARNGLRIAAEALGLDRAEAEAVERLALTIGRPGYVEALAAAKKQRGAVSAYAQALEDGSGATLQKLFDTDGE